MIKTKIRCGFVTNSSSSSYIICFARIKDEEKAQKIIDKHELDVFDTKGVKRKMHWGELGADWAGAIICGVDKLLEKYPNDKYIIIEDGIEADWDDEKDEYIFDYDFKSNDAIDEITEENGFTNIDIQEGEGRDG